ncbi:hypothetical protein H2203_008398 [Taxawa tesnikishii (nom. ined.)]|nr:hypothetical protein H2203_008398 [Dothideales sp. JES 119]
MASTTPPNSPPPKRAVKHHLQPASSTPPSSAQSQTIKSRKRPRESHIQPYPEDSPHRAVPTSPPDTKRRHQAPPATPPSTTQPPPIESRERGEEAINQPIPAAFHPQQPRTRSAGRGFVVAKKRLANGDAFLEKREYVLQTSRDTYSRYHGGELVNQLTDRDVRFSQQHPERDGGVRYELERLGRCAEWRAARGCAELFLLRTTMPLQRYCGGRRVEIARETVIRGEDDRIGDRMRKVVGGGGGAEYGGTEKGG